MLIEVRVKTKRIIEEKAKKKLEIYVVDKEFFSEAEYAVTQLLEEEQASHLIEEYEIQSLKMSSIKELEHPEDGEQTFIATLRDIWLEEDGSEKSLRYKVLLWADNLTQANERAHELARQGYDMQIEGIQEVEYKYLNQEDNAVGETTAE